MIRVRCSDAAAGLRSSATSMSGRYGVVKVAYIVLLQKVTVIKTKVKIISWLQYINFLCKIWQIHSSIKIYKIADTPHQIAQRKKRYRSDWFLIHSWPHFILQHVSDDIQCLNCENGIECHSTNFSPPPKWLLPHTKKWYSFTFLFRLESLYLSLKRTNFIPALFYNTSYGHGLVTWVTTVI